MKKLAVLLAITLLLCLAACGDIPDAPGIPEPQMAVTTESTAAPEASTDASVTFEDPSEQLYFDVFRPAFELAMAFRTTTAANDYEDSFRRGGVYYYRVADPRFASFVAMEATLREMFSEAIARELIDNSPFDYPLYIERDGKTYAVGGRGFPTAMPASFAIEEQSAEKVAYKVKVMFMMTEKEKEYLYTRELIDGKWIFTEFPLDWMQIFSP